MRSLEEIQQESLKEVGRAAREHRVPLTLWPQDGEHVEELLRHTPFLGVTASGEAYSPKPWKEVDVGSYLFDYPYKWFFVDSSGFGGEGEPALTFRAFAKMLCSCLPIAAGRDKVLGIAIVEAGQFQVHIALYERSIS